MFTGIIRGTARITHIAEADGGRDMEMNLADTVGDLYEGQSVAIDGVCLTVAEVDTPRVRFRVMNESLSKTTLEIKETGDLVNIEPSLTGEDELGGHFVYGHVDDIGRIETIEQDGDTHYVTMAVSEEFRQYLVPQGAVAIDGISLTVARLTDTAMTISIIPYTWEITNFHDKAEGEYVNLEADMIMKGVVTYARRYLENKKV